MFYSSCCSFKSNFLFYLPLILFFIFIFPPTHRPCIDPTSTPLRHHIDQHQMFSSTTTTFLLSSFHHHHHHISIVFLPPLSPHFYFFLLVLLLISNVFHQTGYLSLAFDLSLAFLACISPFWSVFRLLPWAWPV